MSKDYKYKHKGISSVISLLLIGALFVSFITFYQYKTRTKTTINNTSLCAKAGERSVDNFNMTTGKKDPNIKIIKCCPGLKNIADKQSVNNEIPEICASSQGKPINLCSPCGNGTCDMQYEDVCNCPEDCN